MKKKKVLFVPSHLYLFWDFGCYYLYQLHKKYSIILLVNKNFLEDKNFKRLTKYLLIDEIICLKNGDNIFDHKNYFISISSILKKYKPDFIFQYNSVYLFNKYIFYLTKKILPKSKVIHYQNGIIRIISSDEEYNKIERFIFFNKIKKKYFIPNFILNSCYHIYKKVFFFLHFIIFPLIILRNLNHEFWKNNSFHHIFVLNDLTRDRLYQTLKNPNISTIKNPIIYTPISYNQFIYEIQNEKSILLLPSLLGFLSFNNEKKNLNLWIKVINHLNKLIPDYTLKIKFHPRVTQNIELKNIKAYLKKYCKNLKILEEDLIVQPLILSSEIVLGDFSSALWWSSLFNKKVISINFDQRYGSNEMSVYKNILYFSNVNQFLNYEFDYFKKSTDNKFSNNKNIKDLDEILDTL